MINDLKKQLLENSNNGLDFFRIYFGAELQLLTPTRFDNIKCPFYHDKNKSFSIYKKENSRWYFHDFGNPYYQGDCFDFYAFVYRLDIKKDFAEILRRMEKVLQDGISQIAEMYSTNDLPDISDVSSVKVHEVPMSDRAKEFWKAFGITENVLKINHVVQIDGYTTIFNDGTTKETWQEDMVFAYDMNGYYKIYYPKTEGREKKFFTYKCKGKREHIFGRHFQNQSDILFLTGGEKDVMTLHSLGYQAICLGSENAQPSRRLVKDLFEDDLEVVVLYDNDEAGRKGAERISETCGWHIADLSTIVDRNKVKDISDYVKQGLSIDNLKCFLDGFAIGVCESDQIEEVEEIEDFSDEVDMPNYICIGESIYNRLPQLFKSITAPITNKIQKDLILIASLGVLSNLIEVSGVYRNKVVYPNLFIFITAPAASGKGAMSWVRRLGSAVQQEYNRQYDNDKAEYEDNKRKGEKPKRKTVFQSANSSVSAFIKQLSKNNGKSTIFETEADSLNGVMKNDDWGSFSDVLRRAFEFEDISMLRVDDEDSVEIENPRLSVVLSGTKEQLFKLIPSAENGLFSRFLFMEFPRQREWDDDLESDESFDAFYNKISEKVYQYYKRCKEGGIRFRLTSVQKHKRKQHYTQLQDEYETLYGEDIVASIRRVANIHLRVAMLLSTIRMLDSEKVYNELVCNDVDFDLAQDLVGWFLNHTTTILGQLPNKPKEYNELKTNVKILYDALQMKFTYQDALSVGDKLKIPNGTVQKHLAKLKKAGLILAEAHGKYSKTKGTN